MGSTLGDDPGKICGFLADTTDEEWTAIEADLVRAGHNGLDDVPSAVGWRSVIALAAASTRGTAFFHQVTGDKGSWSDETHAIVSLIEVLQEFVWLWRTSKINPKKDTPPPRPKPIKRPGVDVIDPFAEKLTGEAMPQNDWAEFWKTGVRPQHSPEEFSDN